MKAVSALSGPTLPVQTLDGREWKTVFHAHVLCRPQVATMTLGLFSNERRRFDRAVTGRGGFKGVRVWTISVCVGGGAVSLCFFCV